MMSGTSRIPDPQQLTDTELCLAVDKHVLGNDVSGVHATASSQLTWRWVGEVVPAMREKDLLVKIDGLHDAVHFFDREMRVHACTVDEDTPRAVFLSALEALRLREGGDEPSRV